MGPGSRIYSRVNDESLGPNLGRHHQAQVMMNPEFDIAWNHPFPTQLPPVPPILDRSLTQQPSIPQTSLDGTLDGPTAEWVARLNRQRKGGRSAGIVKRKKQAALERRLMAPPSKAALKRAELAAQFGEENVASDGDVKGFTRTRADGVLEWYDPSCDQYFPAAPHDTFREEFIKMDQDRYAPYQYEVECGYHELDITSNCDINLQNTWELSKEGFARIKDSLGNPVGAMDSRPANEPRRPECAYLYHNGLIMLDQNNRPIYNWTDIPLCFSSRLEGGRMEALRRVFPWLKVSDFRGRMPRQVFNEHGTLVPLVSTSTLGQRMLRFRESVGCEAWIDRNGDGSNKRKLSPRRMALASASAAMWHQGDPNPPQPTVDPQLLSHPIPNVSLNEITDQYHAIQDDRIARKRSRTAQPPTPPLPTLPPLLPMPMAPMASLGPYSMANNASWYSPGGQSLLVETDYKAIKPQNEADEYHVRSALRLTRADFAVTHGMNPPSLPNGHSYNEHYQFVQQLHEANWLGGEPIPKLLEIESWGGSFSSWEAPVLEPWQLKKLLVSFVFSPF